MTSNFSDLEQIRFFSTAARLANRERISGGEEVWMRRYLDRYRPPQIQEPGFPAAPVGDARDRNNLRRTNWFNGRYLTAEALSRQDVYFDHRSRLNAHALMPGIAWGLGVDGKEGLDEFTLRRGLAFDGVGRPILVSQDFSFTLAELIGVSLKTPRRVVGGGREFTPCVCLAPDPGGPSGGSAALPSGPYLLVIEAGELPEGKAKVTGDVCGGRRNAPCEADVWQGSFGLSLVRFPVDTPLLNNIPDVWALRGTLSAYYFDVFEHPLWKRWDPDFPVDGSFSRDSGPGRHEGMAIPLALVHLGEDGTALYLDSWIPRRLITATPGEDWHRTRFGAPPRAAAWARIHQFQTMLEESLMQANTSRIIAPGQRYFEVNLHQRGFRHIPPIGFLPIRPEAIPTDDQETPKPKNVCTNFSEKDKSDDSLNPYQGDQATFAVDPQRPNQILKLGGAQGLIIRKGEKCTIIPARAAQSARLKWQVNRGESINLQQGIEVISFGSSVSNGGQVILEKRIIKEINIEQSIDLMGQGNTIEKVEIKSFDDTVLIEFCYTYVEAASATISSPSRFALARSALLQAEAFFAGTNVVPYGVVALHDDDILEDLNNVFDKDPLQLEPRKPHKDLSGLNDLEVAKNLQLLGATSKAGLFIFALGYRLRSKGLTIDDLVNRRTEVVKLVAPLQGINRRHPILGIIAEDASDQARGWGLASSVVHSAASTAGLTTQKGVDVLPRGFVLYVKQRLVLLDLVFKMVELLQAFVEMMLTASNQNKNGLGFSLSNQLINTSGSTAVQPDKNVRAMTAATSTDYQVAFRSLPENDRQLIRASIQQPVVQDLLLQTMATTAPAFAKADRSQAFLDAVAAREREQPAATSTAGERKARALAEVADAWATEYPDAQVLQLLSAVQPAEQTLDLVKRLGVAAGPVAGPNVADGLDLKPPTRFESNTERVLYAGVRERLEERPIKDLALDLPEGSLPDTALVASLTVADVLARSPEDAAKVLGGAANVEAITKAFLNDRQAALEASSALADGVPAAVVAKVEAEVAAGQKPEAVLEQLKQQEEEKPEAERDTTLLRNLSHAETLLRVSGNRLDVLRPLRQPPGG